MSKRPLGIATPYSILFLNGPLKLDMSDDRNDPGRFFGDGVTFKAKLIGILEVGEARGDRMCQEALQDLKMAIRAAGEHKQRITIHVTIDGLRLRDEKTSDSLYHHPVHKISFIAQDMTDSRAFGYIFGSPDSGHRFFGIKTDKAASQVVLAMRDLFQVVFELKKKEIEMARQQIQSKIVVEHHISSKVKSTGTDPMNARSNKDASEAEKSNPKKASPESVADLVDLEQELSSIQRGITQMERITPNEPSTTAKIVANEDPFGDSFTVYQLLPPPESTRSRYLRVNKSSEIILSETSTLSSNLQPVPSNSISVPEDTSISTVERLGSTLDKNETTQPLAESHLSTISTTSASSTKTHTCEEFSSPKGNDELSPSFLNASTSLETFSKISFIDVFSDLDPLGTGKSKPYIDKKYFFQDLKNPPKKVLKDLSQKDIFSATFQECQRGQSDTYETSKDALEENIENQCSESPIEKTNFSQDYGSKISESSDEAFKIELNASKITGPIMVKRDTDPFSPTRKKSDPFQEENIFSNLDSCKLDLGDREQPSFPDKNSSSVEAEIPKKDVSIFNRPLQVNLPPESFTSSVGKKKMDKQVSESPIPTVRTRPNVFKQNTVDVISSISSKKMPHLFTQKFSKRDSNNINMRRLQESDSLSENESAPEPPPRPDSTSQAEPPPLPPKKQFADIIIRPRITSSSDTQLPAKYDYVTNRIRYTTEPISEIAPPIPLPSRKIVRTDSNLSGPGRPGKILNEEDDYLTPTPNYQDVPPLLPPPQSKSRFRRHDNIESKTHKETLSSNIEPTAGKPILPDITLNQLLTLSIDEIAAKLNVPTSKLNTMTLVELTACLSNFLEKSKNAEEKTNHSENSSLFKVNFEHSDGTFAAKFEDNFEEKSNSTFTANFENLSATAERPKETPSNIKVPSEDRYAVFREILEQEKPNNNFSESRNDLDNSMSAEFETSETLSDRIQIGQSIEESHKFPVAQIDTKITEVISHAKDRYAALRDIILGEDLFDTPKRSLENLKKSNVDDIDEKYENILKQQENEPEPSHIETPFLDRKEILSSVEPVQKMKHDNTLMATVTVSNADDLEIDEYLHLALSNLSLECQEESTPVMNGSPTVGNIGTSPKSSMQQQNISPVDQLSQEFKSQFNDMSTSPIPQEKSPIMKSHSSKSPHLQSPFPLSSCEADLMDSQKLPDSGSISDAACGSSPDIDRIIESRVEPTGDVVSVNISPSAPADSWAIFGSGGDKKLSLMDDKYTKYAQNSKSQGLPESPCSSDAKEEWKMRKGQNSSSSRDLSPWDEEISEQKKRPPERIDKHGYYMRHARYMNSCDDDYEYDKEILKRRQRRIKGNVTRNKEKFDSDTQNWCHTSNHHNWSPPDEEGSGPQTFYRNAYERGTYGPPLRDRKVLSYDNRYEKRKYCCDYSGPEYDIDSYTDSPDIKERNVSYYSDKTTRDYEDIYLEGFQSRDYCFDRDRKSFDRESVGSYEGTNRQRMFGREEGYGSLDSREEFRERYMGSCEKTNTLRKSVRSNKDGDHIRKHPSDLRNNSDSRRTRKSSGSSPWVCGDAILGQSLVAPCQRTSKRPSSASESERRLCESRRVLCHAVSGSDGEKDKRVRHRSRIRGVEEQTHPEGCLDTYFRGSNQWNIYDFMDCDDYADPLDEDKFARLNSRQKDIHHRLNPTDYSRRRKAFGNMSFYNDNDDVIPSKYESRLKKNSFFSNNESKNSLDVFEDEVPMPHDEEGEHRGFGINIFVQRPQKIPGCNKFNYEEQGFESDFNSSPHLPAGVSPIPVKPSFRFSNDFTEKENKLIVYPDNFEQAGQSSATAPKLRFDDNITISDFSNDRSTALSKFEDDFSTSEFVLEQGDRTSDVKKCNKSSRLLPKQCQQDQIKKSESVNIFGRKSEDPFEDDDFFKSSHSAVTTDEDRNIKNAHVTKCDIENKQLTDNLLKWEDNFAKFDENM